MSEQEWGKGAIFDPAIVRRVAEEPVQIERPIAIDTAVQIAPPVPDSKHVEPRAVLDNPELVELWRQINSGEQPGDTPAADQPPDEASAAAQMCMALYLLQALHGQGKPGQEHLGRGENPPPGPDEEEDADGL
jgi:hypothetical protein